MFGLQFQYVGSSPSQGLEVGMREQVALRCNSGDKKSWHVYREEGQTVPGKTDISGETKLTWANRIYKRIDQISHENLFQ